MVVAIYFNNTKGYYITHYNGNNYYIIYYYNHLKVAKFKIKLK